MFKTQMPRFFKIILHGTIRHGKLGIPRRFVRLYGHELSNVIVLKVPDGTKWQVELVKLGGEIWLQNGLQDFMNYYSLTHGIVLVFEYNQANRDFNVIIFDKSATEIGYPFGFTNEDNHEPNSQSDIRVENLNNFTPHQEMKKRSPSEFSHPDKKIKLENPSGRPQAKKGATTTFKSENPTFMIAMQPTHIHSGKLAIPARFFKEYINKQHGFATLETTGRKTWPVAYCYSAQNGKSLATIGNGWKKFAEENRLDVGDVCVFELLSRTKNTFTVVIFRHCKDANTNPVLENSKHLITENSSSNRKLIPGNSSSSVPENVQAATKFASLNPFFKVNMRPSYLKNGSLSIRREFVRKCTKGSIVCTKRSIVTLQVESRQWPVKLITCSSGGWFSAGWSLFATENSLQLGDICIFELINGETLLLKVHIFRNV